jgi:hypothetical protein
MNCAVSGKTYAQAGWACVTPHAISQLYPAGFTGRGPIKNRYLKLVGALRYPLVGSGLGHGLLEIIFPLPLKSLLMCFEVSDLP